MSDSYANSGFFLENFIHEYGHYLQQQQYGNSTYLVNIAIPSVISGTINSDDHYKQWYEEDATKRGNEYVNGSRFGSNY